MAIPFLACMVLVASLDRLPPRVLPSIAVVESGRVGAINRNSDGSEDLGPMQVNTRWLPIIAQVTHRDITETRSRLLNDACFNISAAGAILRTYLDEAHGDLMQAIGDYHSHTAPLNLNYRMQVIDAATRLFGQRAARQPSSAPIHRAPNRAG
jgi:hypothetical protein